MDKDVLTSAKLPVVMVILIKEKNAMMAISKLMMTVSSALMLFVGMGLLVTIVRFIIKVVMMSLYLLMEPVLMYANRPHVGIIEF